MEYNEEEEIENNEEEIPTKESVSKYAELQDTVLNSLLQTQECGCFLLKNSSEDNYTDEDFENKETQTLEKIDKELLKKQEKDDINEKKIVIKNTDGTIFVGEIELKENKNINNNKSDKGKNDNNKNLEEINIIYPKNGCIYDKKGRLLYKGTFNNGSKYIGIQYSGYGYDNKSKKQIFKNFGGKTYNLLHNENDLLISYEGEGVEQDYINDISKSYKNVLHIKNNGSVQKTQNINNVQNVKIRIDNGYRFNFNDNIQEYINKNGEKIKYPLSDEKKMYINTDAIIQQISEIINTSNEIKNIEIDGHCCFGFLKNEDGKELQNEIIEKLGQQLKLKDINLYISNIDKNEETIETTNEFSNGDIIKEMNSEKRDYYVYNKDNGKFEQKNEDEYRKIQKKNNYFINTNEDKENKNIEKINKLNTEINSYEKYKLEKDNEELRDKNNNIKQAQRKRNYIIQDKKFSTGEKTILVISGIVIPIIGGIIAYFLLNKSELKKTNNNKPNLSLTSNNKAKTIEKN